MVMKPSLCLLIPAYNEEKLLENAVEYYYSYLKKLKTINSFEVIICVNGSIDNTEKIAKRLSEKHKEIRYLTTSKKGLGIALKMGMLKAKEDYIAYMPGDGEIDANFIGSAIKLMDSESFVIGSRRMAGEYKGKSIFRKILSYGLNFVTAILLSSKVSEAFSVKMYPTKWAKKIEKHLKENGFASQIEMVYYALKDRLEIKKAPSKVFYKKEASQSSVRIINTIWSTFLVTLKYGIKLKKERILSLFQ